MNEQELLYHHLRSLHLLERAPKAAVAADLLGLQAQFSRNPQLSLRLRASDYAPETWDNGLVKIWSHRGTMHVIRAEELGLHLSAVGQCGDFVDTFRLSAEEQRTWAPFIAEQVRGGNDTRDGLKQAARSAGMSDDLVERVFYGWGGLIKEMCLRGLLACRTGSDKRYLVPETPQLMPRDDARRILIRRYFAHYGPASRQDCLAFFGYRAEAMRPLLDELLPTLDQAMICGVPYYYAEPLPQVGALPECVLISGFDQLVLGYKDRSCFLDPKHARKLTNISGIVFPAILLRGKLRARWRLEGDEVQVTPFEHLYRKDEAAIHRTVRDRLGKGLTVSFAAME